MKEEIKYTEEEVRDLLYGVVSYYQDWFLKLLRKEEYEMPSSTEWFEQNKKK